MRPRDAVRRGFDFLCSAICEPEAFEAYGFDYLFSLLTSLNSRDRVVRRQVQEVGHALALQWVAQHPTVPPEADADTIAALVFGSLSARGFGVTDSLKPALLAAAPNFAPADYCWFDPAIEPPPNDVHEECESRYEAWLLAIIRSYIGERYGVKLGAPYADVLKWVPQMRPYPSPDDETNYIWSIYAITHIVYTLNDYNSYCLDRRSLPDEFDVLRKSLDVFIEMDDPETVGEILDSLKSFKVTSSSALMQRGIRFLLDRQNADGSWGEPDVHDPYDWHHTTIAALNGLDEYSWDGKVRSISINSQIQA